MQLGPSLLPDDDELELLHQRSYETRVYLVDDGHILVRGIITDNKPPGMYVDDDPDPLEMHRMQADLTVRLEDLTVTEAKVVFTTHPFETCPVITETYQQLIGLNVARGFNRRIRELFGGPRGCTHTTALLQAMAPAVHQSMWSVAIKLAQRAEAEGGPDSVGADPMAGLEPEEAEARRTRALQANMNTCHIWAEDGERVERFKQGDNDHTPLPIRERLVSLQRKPDSWP